MTKNSLGHIRYLQKRHIKLANIQIKNKKTNQYWSL